MTKEKREQQLLLIDFETGEILAKHTLWNGKGQLVKDRNHARDTTSGIPELAAQLIPAFSNHPLVETYLKLQHKAYPRYVRDQYSLIKQLVKEHPQAILDEALVLCMNRKLYSATDFKAVVTKITDRPQLQSSIVDSEVQLPTREETSKRIQQYETEMRDLSIYTAILRGDNFEATS
ncbi:hypothetical protein IGI37_000263 [Enterococcus sp. AZ194]|uniref:hypothetical protein n=1 Tax=Enterococcus sp. AZ194 TaxID=2774629 RepID=UPI003F24ACCA